MDTLHVEAGGPWTPLRPVWSPCVGAGRAAEGLRASWLDHLALVHRECGFERVRFHGLLHDDMGVLPRAGGAPCFLAIDDLFDRMLDLGVRPFVELGFLPRPLASVKETCFWWKAHASPPKDLTAWAALVEALVRHLRARYGAEELRAWFFEVWNEPNLRPFWVGTYGQYLDLYAAAARAIKAVDGDLLVGGPATSNFVPDGRFDGEAEDVRRHATWTGADPEALPWRPVWVERFLADCARRGLPVDFVTTHPYPTDWGLDGHGVSRGRSRGRDCTGRDLALLQDLVRASPFPRAGIHCTEWNSSPSSRDPLHDALPAATWALHGMQQALGRCDSLSWWTFTDVFEELGPPPSSFHGGFGLVNAQGIPKPAFHAFRLLHRLGPRLLGRGDGHLCAGDGLGAVQVLGWHYPATCPTSPPLVRTREQALALGAGPSVHRRVVVTGLAPGTPWTLELVDAAHGDAVTAWERLGAPEPPDRGQVRDLCAAAGATVAARGAAGGDGRVEVTVELSPWAAFQLRCGAAEARPG